MERERYMDAVRDSGERLAERAPFLVSVADIIQKDDSRSFSYNGKGR